MVTSSATLPQSASSLKAQRYQAMKDSLRGPVKAANAATKALRKREEKKRQKENILL